MKSLLLLFLGLSSTVFAQSIVQVIPLPSSTYWNSAWGLTADSAHLYISSNRSTATEGRKIFKLNFSGQIVDSILLPTGIVSSQGLARDAAGNFYYLRRYTANGTIMKFSPAGALIDTLRLPSNKFPGGIAWDGNYVWYSIYSPDAEAGLYKVNWTTKEVVDTILVPTKQPYGITWDGTYLWYVENGFQSDPQGMFKVNPVTKDTAGFVPAPVDPGGTRPNDAAWDGHYMWLLAEPLGANTGRSLYKYDLGGGGTPDINLFPPSLNFGNRRLIIPISYYKDSVSIQNVGSASLRIDSVKGNTAGGAFFTTISTPVTIPPSGLVPFVIGWSPQVFGLDSVRFTMYSNDPDESEVTFKVSGFGIYGNPRISVPTSNNFGVKRVGSSNTWLLTIQNQGGPQLSISSISTSNAAFKIDSVGLPLVIDSLGTATVRVWFRPVVATSYIDTIKISSNASNGPTTKIVVSGSGDATPVPLGQPFWTYTVPNNPRTSSNSKLMKAVRAISDITGDGKPDIVVSCENYWTMALNGNASGTNDSLWAFNTFISNNSAGSIGTTGDYSHQKALAVADLNRDGKKDVIIGTGGGNEHVYALDGRNGRIIWQFGTDAPDSFGLGDITAVDASTDYNNDGIPDVLAAAAATDQGGTGCRRTIYLFNGSLGNILWQSPLLGFTHGVASVADLNGDGKPDAIGCVGEPSYKAVAYNGSNGGVLWEFPVATATGGAKEVMQFPRPAQPPDIIVGAFWGPVYRVRGTDGGQVWSYSTGGTGGGGVMQLARLKDVTGDGVDEVLAALLGNGIVCINGATGTNVWSLPTGNTMGISTIPDLNNDGFDDVAIAVQNQGTMIVRGQDGVQLGIYPTGSLQTREVATVPDMDGNGSFEIIMGGQQGNVALLSGGNLVTDVGVSANELPQQFELSQNYPNPFNPITTINISLPAQSDFSLKIFDLLGREVRSFVFQRAAAGKHQIVWDGKNESRKNVASGVYLYQFRTNEVTLTRRMILLR